MSLQFMIEIGLAGADVDAFDRYEDLVLGLFEEHGGQVVARVRDAEARREWHLLRVPSRTVWEAFLADPRRAGHAGLLERANVEVRRHEVRSVG
jgi:hypothetical protein